ncbi:MAG: hypothetical protein ACSLEX_04455 [Minisyncoccota bacterium]
METTTQAQSPDPFLSFLKEAEVIYSNEAASSEKLFILKILAIYLPREMRKVKDDLRQAKPVRKPRTATAK